MPSLLPILVLLLPSLSLAGALFDAHVHYNAAHAEVIPPEGVLEQLAANQVQAALVTGMPPATALDLYRAAPERILPLLGVYRQPEDKQDWHRDETLPAWVERQLQAGPWRGIGELHIFAADRHSPVLLRLAQLASARDLPLLLHADPAVVDALYERFPDLALIWAHAGAYPYPDLLADYLERYPRLHVDLSVRDDRVAPDGMLTDAWYRLLVEHADRFLVGVDTFSVSRWRDYGRVIGDIRRWLGQLPPGVAARLERENALRLFGMAPESRLRQVPNPAGSRSP